MFSILEFAPHRFASPKRWGAVVVAFASVLSSHLASAEPMPKSAGECPTMAPGTTTSSAKVAPAQPQRQPKPGSKDVARGLMPVAPSSAPQLADTLPSAAPVPNEALAHSAKPIPTRNAAPTPKAAKGQTQTVAQVPSSKQSALSAAEILKESDRARGGSLKTGLSMTSKLTSYENGKSDKSYAVQIESEDGNSLVTFVKPATSRGTKMLIKDRNMWFLSPDVKRPVPISPRQRLLGQAANGDVATTNFSEDYEPTLVSDETVAGQPCYVLELKAKSDQVTYDRIMYYVSKVTMLGLKAEYYTVSGRILKAARFTYDHLIMVDGTQTPLVSRIVITDSRSTKKTVLEYAAPRVGRIPSARFHLQSLLSK